MAESQDRGQVNTEAAEIYERFFIPAIFGQWPEKLINAAEVKQGDKVLDVACGTGVVARALLKAVGETGKVTGIDINEGMLAVADRMTPEVDWINAPAENLPFDDETFDSVFCQFALMFFVDRAQALREMHRVLKPGGKMVIAVWDSLDTTPGYFEVVNMLHRLFGDDAANALRSPFNLGNTATLNGVFADAGYENAEIITTPGEAQFPSIESWMFTDIRGWTLSDMINDEQYATLLAEASTTLKQFEQPDGSVRFPAPAHVVTVSK